LGPGPFQTAALKVRISAGGVENVEPVPLYIDPWENRPRPALLAEVQAILDRIQGPDGSLEAP